MEILYVCWQRKRINKIRKKCKKIHDIFIASKKYSELNDKVISLNELKNYPLIFQEKGSNTRNFLDNFLKEKNITLKPNIELASYSLVTEFCKAGFGIGFERLLMYLTGIENIKDVTPYPRTVSNENKSF